MTMQAKINAGSNARATGLRRKDKWGDKPREIKATRKARVQSQVKVSRVTITYRRVSLAAVRNFSYNRKQFRNKFEILHND